MAVSLSFAVAGTLTVEEHPCGEIRIIPNGVNPSPNWGLDKIGEQQDDGQAYTYPDTSNPVRLYLIDTAVANPGDWIGANPNLTFEGTTLIRSYGQPVISTEFGHGTKMLSLIAGLDTGVAPGTPIRVRNYDVYPGGLATTATKLATAVEEAVAHYEDSDPRIPSVICLASASNMLGSSDALRESIEHAVEKGLTVVVSSGNGGSNAASYIPASYGTIPGVICVGASNAADMKISMSNSGTPVDILAPGHQVRVIDQLGSRVQMDGTSPAAALVAGSALAELSMNGSLTPAQVEARLIASAKAGSPPVLRTTAIAAATIALPDGPITDPSSPTPLACSSFPAPTEPAPAYDAPAGDRASSAPPELLQVFHGGDAPSAASCSVSVLPQNHLEFRFPVDFSLLDPSDPFTLRNGYSWRIRCSENMDSWDVPQGSLSKKTAPDGTVWLTATVPATTRSCFLRIEVADTPAP